VGVQTGLQASGVSDVQDDGVLLQTSDGEHLPALRRDCGRGQPGGHGEGDGAVRKRFADKGEDADKFGKFLRFRETETPSITDRAGRRNPRGRIPTPGSNPGVPTKQTSTKSNRRKPNPCVFPRFFAGFAGPPRFPTLLIFAVLLAPDSDTFSHPWAKPADPPAAGRRR
jgi:hypothetical protein